MHVKSLCYLSRLCKQLAHNPIRILEFHWGEPSSIYLFPTLRYKKDEKENPDATLQDQDVSRVKLTGMRSKTFFSSVLYGIKSSDITLLRQVVFSDECIFHVSEIANMQSSRILGSEDPRQMLDSETRSENINLGCSTRKLDAVSVFLL